MPYPSPGSPGLFLHRLLENQWGCWKTSVMQSHKHFRSAEFNESRSWLMLFDFTALFWPVSLHMPIRALLSSTHNTGAMQYPN